MFTTKYHDDLKYARFKFALHLTTLLRGNLQCLMIQQRSTRFILIQAQALVSHQPT